MKYLMLLPLFLGIVFLSRLAVCGEESLSESGTYQWVDDNGSVHFTDNPMNIPVKKLKNTRKRPSVQGKVSQDPVSRVSSSSGYVTQLSPMLYGGHNEAWWRARFAGLKSQIQGIKDGMPAKEVRLKELHFKKVTSNAFGMSPGVSGNPRQRKTAYLGLHAEIEADKERLANLESELENLKREAASLGVPSRWQ